MKSDYLALSSQLDAILASSIGQKSNQEATFIDQELLSLQDELIKQGEAYQMKPSSPSLIINSKYCSNIHEEINDINLALKAMLPHKISSPYSFSDVKILNNEFYAIAVTSEGHFIHLNLFTNHFSEKRLCSFPLSVVIVYDSDTLAFAKERDRAIIYNIEIRSMNVLKAIDICTKGVSGIGKLCLSPQEDYLYARLWKGKIIRWHVKDLDKAEVMLKDKNVICMNISPDGVVVVGTKCNEIILFSLTLKKIAEKRYNFLVDAYIHFSKSGDLIILGMLDSIKIIEKQSLELINDIYTGCLSYSLLLTHDEKYIISGLSTGELGFFHRDSTNQLRIKIHTSSILSITSSSDSRLIYTFGDDSKLAQVRFPLLSLFKNSSEINLPFNGVLMTSRSHDEDSDFFATKKAIKEETFKPLCMAQSDRQDIIIVGGESNNVAVWDRLTMKKYGELMGHTGYVYSLASLSDAIVASGSADSKVILWNYRKLRRVSILSGHTDAVSAVVKIDNSRLASGSWDRTVRIWVWEVESLIFCIRDLPEKVVALCIPKYSKLFIGMKNMLHCWDLVSYCVMFEKESEGTISCFRIFEEKAKENKSVYIGLGMEAESLWIEDPFLSKNIEIWGRNGTGSYTFLSYITKISNNYSPAYRKAMDKYIVFPYNINALHFYAYYNMPEYLSQAIFNGAPLLVSNCYSSPLSIAIEMNHKSCVESIISSIWQLRNSNPYLLSVLSISSLDKLHSMDTNILSKVYKMIMVNMINKAKISLTGPKLPLIRSSTHSTLVIANWVTPYKKKEESELVRFYQSAISLYLSPGSLKSINYLYSLSCCKDRKIFHTQFISMYIGYKWKIVKWAIFCEILMFFGYYIGIMAHVLLGAENSFRSLCLLSGILVSVIELITSVSFLNYWTYISTIQLLLLLIELFFSDDTLVILSLALVVSTLYGFKYFDLMVAKWDLLEYMIAAFKDVLALVVMLLYCIISFLCVAKIIKLNPSFGSEEDSAINVLKMVAVAICIAITAGTLSQSDKFKADREASLIRTILKVEMLMIWKRKENNKEFLQVCEKLTQKPKDYKKDMIRTVKNISKTNQDNFSKLSDWKAESMNKIRQIDLDIKTLIKQKTWNNRPTTKTF